MGVKSISASNRGERTYDGDDDNDAGKSTSGRESMAKTTHAVFYTRVSHLFFFLVFFISFFFD